MPKANKILQENGEFSPNLVTLELTAQIRFNYDEDYEAARHHLPQTIFIFLQYPMLIGDGRNREIEISV